MEPSKKFFRSRHEALRSRHEALIGGGGPGRAPHITCMSRKGTIAIVAFYVVSAALVTSMIYLEATLLHS